MTDYNAGNFKASVSGPYPMWTTITFGDQQFHNIRHDELPDLLHVVQRAIAEAKRKLGKDAHEVE